MPRIYGFRVHRQCGDKGVEEREKGEGEKKKEKGVEESIPGRYPSDTVAV